MSYEELVVGPLLEYLSLSKKIGDVVLQQAEYVEKAFMTQKEFLSIVEVSKKPDDVRLEEMLKPTSDAMQIIQAHREKNRTSKFFNHLSAVSESISVLGWVVVTPDPSKYAKELHSAGAYFGNKVITSAIHKDALEVMWAKAWLNVLSELQTLIHEKYRWGPNWNTRPISSIPPPGFPPPPPPPPPVEALSTMQVKSEGEDARSALLRDLNQGSDITKCLKKVQKGSKESNESKILLSSTVKKAPVKVPVKNPKFERDGRKWILEHLVDKNDIKIEDVEMNQSAYIYGCENSMITVKGKINCITIDTCKRLSLTFDQLVSALEIINCKDSKVQILLQCPTAIIDKSSNIILYLSEHSLGVEIVSSLSSEINIALPHPTRDFAEHPVPEQLKTTIVNGKLKTVAVDKM